MNPPSALACPSPAGRPALRMQASDIGVLPAGVAAWRQLSQARHTGPRAPIAPARRLVAHELACVPELPQRTGVAGRDRAGDHRRRRPRVAGGTAVRGNEADARSAGSFVLTMVVPA